MAGKKTTEYPAKQRQLNDDIAKGNFKPCYLIYGEEAYLRIQNRDKLKKALMGGADAMNLQRYEGTGLDPTPIIDMANTLPFFAERRVIIVEDSGFFKTGCPALADYLKNPCETTAMVFIESEVDRRKDMYKAVHASGFDMECDVQDEQTLARWIAGKFREQGKSISARTAAVFINRVGTDMFNISHEVEKLTSYCLDRNEITEDDVDAVCANWLTSRIFEMTDAIVMKDQAKAMHIYNELLALKTAPEQILALIMRQFNQLLQTKDLLTKTQSDKDIASKLSMHPFVAQKMHRWANDYSFADLKASLDLCLESDAAVKSGRLDRNISVEMIIVRMASR